MASKSQGRTHEQIFFDYQILKANWACSEFGMLMAGFPTSGEIYTESTDEDGVRRSVRQLWEYYTINEFDHGANDLIHLQQIVDDREKMYLKTYTKTAGQIYGDWMRTLRDARIQYMAAVMGSSRVLDPTDKNGVKESINKLWREYEKANQVISPANPMELQTFINSIAERLKKDDLTWGPRPFESCGRTMVRHRSQSWPDDYQT